MGFVSGIDVGGTKTLVETYGGGPEPLYSREFPTPRTGDILGILARAVEEQAGTGGVDGVAVACPGPLDPREGVVLNPPNLSREWWGLRLAEGLGERLGRPVAVENDANLGALGEAVYGTGERYGSLLYITVSTGIGAGLVLGEEVFGGSRGFAGELGHVVVAENGPRCGCGRVGCLEVVASGSAIARRAREAGWSPPPEEPADARAVISAFSGGDEAARRILEESAAYLGRSIVDFLYAYDPEAVVLGGGVASSEAFVDLVREAVDREPMMPAFR
nr:ROK family protein [Rubrobacter sp.]